MASAVQPSISPPMGPAPMESVSMPKHLPRMSSRAISRIIVACIAPNPAVPSPSISINASDTPYHCENENSSNITSPAIEPPRNTRPWCVRLDAEAIRIEPINAPIPSNASSNPISVGPTCSTSEATTGISCWYGKSSRFMNTVISTTAISVGSL